VALVSSDVPHHGVLPRSTGIVGEAGVVGDRASGDDGLGALHGVARQRVRVGTEPFEGRRPWLLVLQDSIAHTLKVLVRMPDSWMLELTRSGLAELDIVEVGRRDGSVESRDVCD
jgi:hypothetical protein